MRCLHVLFAELFAVSMSVETAEVLLPCEDFPNTLAYFTNHLGFVVLLIFPADDPEVAVVQGKGLTLRLDRKATGPVPILRLKRSSDSRHITPPPKGICIEWVEKSDGLIVPELIPSLVLTSKGEDGSIQWIEGRAGMLYRDLVPDRQGGRFICSHIRIPTGGIVPDYVHYHHVRFQMIYCYKGGIEVVYQDQGPPFFMKAGDCVLQPPHIRHRVLSCSPESEVIEISCPARHNTLGDPEIILPTAAIKHDRLFSGQLFMRHQAEQAQWQPMKNAHSWEQACTKMSLATAGLAGARVLRKQVVTAQDAEIELESASEFAFRFVLQGSVDLQVRKGQSMVMTQRLSEGDAFVIPGNMSAGLANAVADTRILEVTLPAL